MKKLIALLVVAVAITTFSCKKSSDVQSSGSSLQLSATKVSHIGKKEPVTFSVTNSSSNAVVWKAVPPKGVWYSVSGNKAYMRFTIPGSYKVYATVGANMDSTIITIDSTIYNGDTTLPGTNLPMDTSWHAPTDSTNLPVDTSHHDTTVVTNRDTTISLIGDQLAITPAVWSQPDSTITNPALFLNTTTSNSYPNVNAQLLTTSTSLNTGNVVNGIHLDYKGVFLPGGVTSGTSKATNSLSYGSLTDGTYSLVITVNGLTYTGSFVKSGNTYTFTWPYSSGVIISPLTVTK